MPLRQRNIIRYASILAVILEVVAFAGLAQDSKIDSLKNLLTAAKDTTEIRILNQLSESLRRKKPLDGISYGEQALAKAEKMAFKPGMVLALHNLGVAHGFNNDYPRALDYFLRSAELAEQDKLFKSAANDYTNIGSVYSVQGDAQKWLEDYLRALKIYERIGDKKGMGSVLYGIGNSMLSEKNTIWHSKLFQIDSIL